MIHFMPTIHSACIIYYFCITFFPRQVYTGYINIIFGLFLLRTTHKYHHWLYNGCTCHSFLLFNSLLKYRDCNLQDLYDLHVFNGCFPILYNCFISSFFISQTYYYVVTNWSLYWSLWHNYIMFVLIAHDLYSLYAKMWHSSFSQAWRIIIIYNDTI